MIKQNQFSIYLIIFIEGFVSIAVEVLSIRQLIPFVGNSVIITSQIIGFFLLFLALGYYRGGLHRHHLPTKLRLNLTFAMVFLGFGLSIGFLNLAFIHFYHQLMNHTLVLLWIYLLIIIAPLSYFLGQTLPITLNLLPRKESAGQQAGYVLALSTIGSFLGAVLTALVFMNTFGVAITIFTNVCLLALLSLVLTHNRISFLAQLLVVAFILCFSFICNITAEKSTYTRTTAYGNYQIAHLPHEKKLIINNSPSSVLHQNKSGFAYIELIKKLLFQQLKVSDKQILVLGAGGFTLSAQRTYGNHFTYVDIDKRLPKIVKPNFIHTINGKFIAADARLYMLHDQKKYSVIVTDTFSSLASIPSYLLTANFFSQIKKHLLPSGVAVFNIIANPMLNNAYSKRIDNTLRAVFSNCMSIPLHYRNAATNIIYLCQPNAQQQNHGVYTDNKNQSSVDYFNSH